MRVTEAMARVAGVSGPATLLQQGMRSATQEGKGRGKATKEGREENWEKKD